MPFSEHVINLLLIIIAVGMTELIIGTARLFKEYDRMKFYLPATNIIVFFFLYYLLAFFDSYFLLVNLKRVTLTDIIAVGYAPLASVYVSYFIFPAVPEEGIIDLKANFFKYPNVGPILSMSIAIFRVTRNVGYYHESIFLLENAVEAMFIPLFIFGVFKKDDLTQGIGTSLLLAGMVLLIYLYSLKWLG